MDALDPTSNSAPVPTFSEDVLGDAFTDTKTTNLAEIMDNPQQSQSSISDIQQFPPAVVVEPPPTQSCQIETQPKPFETPVLAEKPDDFTSDIKIKSQTQLPEVLKPAKVAFAVQAVKHTDEFRVSNFSALRGIFKELNTYEILTQTFAEWTRELHQNHIQNICSIEDAINDYVEDFQSVLKLTASRNPVISSISTEPLVSPRENIASTAVTNLPEPQPVKEPSVVPPVVSPVLPASTSSAPITDNNASANGLTPADFAPQTTFNPGDKKEICKNVDTEASWSNTGSGMGEWDTSGTSSSKVKW